MKRTSPKLSPLTTVAETVTGGVFGGIAVHYQSNALVNRDIDQTRAERRPTRLPRALFSVGWTPSAAHVYSEGAPPRGIGANPTKGWTR